jgi:hypothetical protein
MTTVEHKPPKILEILRWPSDLSGQTSRTGTDDISGTDCRIDEIEEY